MPRASAECRIAAFRSFINFVPRDLEYPPEGNNAPRRHHFDLHFLRPNEATCRFDERSSDFCTDGNVEK